MDKYGIRLCFDKVKSLSSSLYAGFSTAAIKERVWKKKFLVLRKMFSRDKIKGVKGVKVMKGAERIVAHLGLNLHILGEYLSWEMNRKWLHFLQTG